MRLTTIVGVSLLAVSSSCFAAEIPSYDIDSICWDQAIGLFEKSKSNPTTQPYRPLSPEKEAYVKSQLKNNCVEDNQYAYYTAKRLWGMVPEVEQQKCISESDNPGLYSSRPFILLKNCLVRWTNQNPVPQERKFRR